MPIRTWLTLVIVLVASSCSKHAGDKHLTPASIDELFVTTDDVDLCDGVFCAIAEVTGNQIDAANEPEPCRTVTLVWQSGGIIGNGGFRYLFEGDFNGDPGYRLTAAAYQKIGANDAYAAFRDALALFPNTELPADIEERLRLYESHPEDILDAVDSRFFAADGDIQRMLARFIRSNRDAIREYLIRKL